MSQPGSGRSGASEPTLRELTVRAMGGDHEAFERLHRRVGAGLRRVLMSRSGGREDLVDDLSQKTWSAVWKAMREGKYDPERSAITTFVYAVGNNAWLTHLRGFARSQGYVEGAPATLGGAHVDALAARDDQTMPPEDAATLAETIERVRACLRDGGPGGLTEQERAVVRAIAAGESDRGLARRLGLSSSTVNIRKHAGYAKIRAYLKSIGLGGEAFEEPDRVAGGSGGGGGEEALAADHAGRLP